MAAPTRATSPHSWRGFVALPENQSALRAARVLSRALVRPKGRVPFGPLVLHGPTGTGKTRLIAALADHLARGPYTIQILAAADLARATAAAETGPETEPTFIDDSLRTCDLFVLEDLHQLPAKAADALCDLLDRRLAGRHMATVFTANAGPAAMTHLPRRLTSRLTAGLVVQLEPLSPKSRLRLLRREAKVRGLKLTADALDTLAARATGGGIRPSIGMLNTLAAHAPNPLEPLDRATMEVWLRDAGQPAAEGPTLAGIVARTAAAFRVSEKDLLGRSRLRRSLVPRQAAMYLARELTKLSFPRIGAFFGGRDHTTVLHACRKVEADMAADERFAGVVRQLRGELQ